MSGLPDATHSEGVRSIHGVFHAPRLDTVRLGRRIGAGAEGKVYEIHGRDDLVAKIYHEPPPPEKAEKLVALSRLGNERLFNLSAWPVDTLRAAPDGSVTGFVMKKISHAEEVHALHSPRSRLQKFPDASWAFLIYVAANIARAVAAVHEHGLVIGDVNPKNILVTRRATVFLLDVDSFQVSVDGRIYRCEGGFPEYTPPELQGGAFRDIDRSPEHDCFGLAVVIFQLLFMGRHPFSGRYLGAGDMPLERAIREFRFAYGADAEAREMRQPPGALALDSLPPPLAGLFHRAFLSTDRPGPREWVEQLDALAKTLKKCDLHSGHYYYRELRACPWCELESHARVRLFNFLFSVEDSRRGHFRLDEVWEEIMSVMPPDTSLVRLDRTLKAPEPSAEVAALAQDRRASLAVSLIFSVIAGLMISVFTHPSYAFFPLVLAGLIVCAIGRLEWTVTAWSRFWHRQPGSGDPLLEKVRTRLRHAEEAAQRLQERYDREAGDDLWTAKRDELKNRKETYENLAEIRRLRLQQLEADARESQLNEFLEQFEIHNAEINGISPTVKTALLSHGVETAADVIEDVTQIPSIGRWRADRLLEWRRDLERKFVFDPARGVSPEDRVRTEREIDALRLRLESELRGGAHYLRHVKQEIEASREKLQSAMTQACQELAQAMKDMEVASNRNSLILILAALVIAFFIGAIIKPPPNLSRAPQPPGVTQGDNFSFPSPPNVELDRKAMLEKIVRMQKGRELYSKGVDLSRKERFAEAVEVFREAVKFDSRHAGAYQELGYALYCLKKYEESVNASAEAAKLSDGFRPYYHLGLAYIALKRWGEAKTAFERAIAPRAAVSHRDAENGDDLVVLAYYYLGLSKARLGEAELAIESLESRLASNPRLILERLELGCLYLCVGKREAARGQYRMLKASAPALAKELLPLINEPLTIS